MQHAITWLWANAEEVEATNRSWWLFEQKSSFLGERGTFLSGDNIPGESPMRHKHSYPPPKQCIHIEVTARKARKKLRNSLLTLKYRAEQFSKDFSVSGDVPYCRFCQHNVNWKCVDTCKDHLRPKYQVQNTENTAVRVRSNGKISIKGLKKRIPVN